MRKRDNRDSKDNRDSREIFVIPDLAVVLVVSAVSVVSKKTYQARDPNFLSEVVRCGTSQKKPSRDSTNSTALDGLSFCDVPQIAAYHKKFKN